MLFSWYRGQSQRDAFRGSQFAERLTSVLARSVTGLALPRFGIWNSNSLTNAEKQKKVTNEAVRLLKKNDFHFWKLSKAVNLLKKSLLPLESRQHSDSQSVNRYGRREIDMVNGIHPNSQSGSEVTAVSWFVLDI
jgi:hypothetical protein